MTPTQAIEQARQQMVEALPEKRTVTLRKYVWVKYGPEWGGVRLLKPPDPRPYYLVEVTGQVENGIAKYVQWCINRSMCLTTEPSHMSGTILYAAETTVNDRLIHVMGYQNRAENLGSGPNAMLLPIPSALPMGPDNALDMKRCPNLLRDYEKTYIAMSQPQSRGTKGMTIGYDDDVNDLVQVFDSGSYTVVLARDAKYIPSALAQVPESKRPSPNPAIFEAYSKLYPGWHIALCCYNGTIDAEPMVWQYEPLDPSKLFAPALDGHDGRPPNLNAHVRRDHTIIVSSVQGMNVKTAYRLPPREDLPNLSGDVVPEAYKPYFGRLFQGIRFQGTTLNGDVYVSIDRLHAIRPGDFRIAHPPGA